MNIIWELTISLSLTGTESNHARVRLDIIEYLEEEVNQFVNRNYIHGWWSKFFFRLSPNLFTSHYCLKQKWPDFIQCRIWPHLSNVAFGHFLSNVALAILSNDLAPFV
jgi:hypothetical protein